MSRRRGQNPCIEIQDGNYTFRYWKGIAGEQERQRVRITLGSVAQMTASEAERRKKEFLANEAGVNVAVARMPSVTLFSDAVKYYRDVFAPKMLRDNTFSTNNNYIKKHLEADWNDTPVDHIGIDAVNEWAWKKRKQGLSWTTIKNILRALQRVLPCNSKDQKPPFSMKGLTIPQRDRLQMKIKSREHISFSWDETQKIVAKVQALDDLDEDLKKRYVALFTLASGSGLRCEELFALRMDDLNFKAGTIRVDEAVDQRTGKIQPCKKCRRLPDCAACGR